MRLFRLLPRLCRTVAVNARNGDSKRGGETAAAAVALAVVGRKHRRRTRTSSNVTVNSVKPAQYGDPSWVQLSTCYSGSGLGDTKLVWHVIRVLQLSSCTCPCSKFTLFCRGAEPLQTQLLTSPPAQEWTVGLVHTRAALKALRDYLTFMPQASCHSRTHRV